MKKFLKQTFIFICVIIATILVVFIFNETKEYFDDSIETTPINDVQSHQNLFYKRYDKKEKDFGRYSLIYESSDTIKQSPYIYYYLSKLEKGDKFLTEGLSKFPNDPYLRLEISKLKSKNINYDLNLPKEVLNNFSDEELTLIVNISNILIDYPNFSSALYDLIWVFYRRILNNENLNLSEKSSIKTYKYLSKYVDRFSENKNKNKFYDFTNPMFGLPDFTRGNFEKILSFIETQISIYESIDQKYIFKDLKSSVENSQFRGNAFVGNLQGECLMVFDEGEKINQNSDERVPLMRLKYELIDYVSANRTVAEETFIVSDLERLNRNESEVPLRSPNQYSNFYIKGRFESLKVSINGGVIQDGNGEGDIYYLIDSLGKNLKCVMIGTGKYEYSANIKLKKTDHFDIKKVIHPDLDEEEKVSILKSYDKISFSGDNLEYLNDKWVYSISKKDFLSLPNVSNVSGKNFRQFLKLNLKNVINDQLSDLRLVILPYSKNSVFSRDTNIHPLNKAAQTSITGLMKKHHSFYNSDKKLLKSDKYNRDYLYLPNLISEGDYVYNLKVDLVPRDLDMYSDYYFKSKLKNGKYIDHPSTKLKENDLFKDNEFLNVLLKSLELPFLVLVDRSDNVLGEIYLKFTD